LELSKRKGMAKNLVIVESPAKAKTIESYLGSEYLVTSSYGHVRDLPKDDKAIDVKNNYKPTYEIPKEKKEVISQLKKLVKDSEMIYLASDDDREGEAISWHLKEALDLDDARIRRIVFHEITKNAILNAIKSPRNIDLDLVNAQQARRVLDRLVGFEISPVLWKKIKTGLSAGRVQSVAVRLVVDREREIEKFDTKSFYKISAIFDLEKGKQLKADLPERFETLEEAEKFLEECKGAAFTISNLEKKPGKKSPAPPFTTSTLQQEASRKMGFSVSQTMTLAQKLYEAGHISYMRTDSVNLSAEAVDGAKNEIVGSYGQDYLEIRSYKTKSKSAQEAHEAIRPTNFANKSAGASGNEERLYELIWKRAIASQMADAKIEKTTATISISTNDRNFVATGEVIKFDGFLKVYIESTDDDENGEENKSILPPLEIGEVLNLNNILARQGFTRPPARYTEASLVKKLEEMGIGRPSTYAPTITTIQKRNYVLKESREGKERKYFELILQNDEIAKHERVEITGTEKNKLFPTNMAMIVNDFLVNHFPNVIDFSFTANVEKEFDDIAQGKIEWDKMIDSFYNKFHSEVVETEQLEKSKINASRELGVDPASGEVILARMGRFGPVVQIGSGEDDKKPKYASMRKGQFIESISLEEALELFKLPRTVGEYEGLEIEANVGRFGPYLRHNNKFYSIPKEDDPHDIEQDRAIEIIEAKRKADNERLIKTFDEDPNVQVLNGRWGPYIKFGKKNVKIPKGKTPAELTFAECKELADKTPEKSKRKKK